MFRRALTLLQILALAGINAPLPALRAAGEVPALTVLPPPRSEITAEERRRRELFLKAREEMYLVRPTPSPTARPRPSATVSPRPTATPTPSPRATATPEPEERPTATPRQTPEPEPSPTPRPATPAPSPTPRPTASARPSVTPRTTPTVTPKPSPSPTAARGTPRPSGSPAAPAPVTVTKSGLEEDQGLEPAPSPQKRGWIFGGPKYKYLSRDVRKAIEQAPVRRGRWKYIIIHNSGTREGNARIFGYYHKNVRKMPNGLAYHFVIGNGTSSGDGEIEIGSRWTRQIQGGHVASDFLNNIALGICLVGDFNRAQPTKAQNDALAELVDFLRGRVGRIDGRRSIVKAHREINPRPTDCPGRLFPYTWMHRRFD